MRKPMFAFPFAALAVTTTLAAIAAGEVVVSSVVIEGTDSDTASALAAELATRTGAPLSDRAVAADIGRLWRSGRFTDIAVESEAGGALIVFTVVESPLAAQLLTHARGGALVEDILVRGNSKTRDAVIRRELTFGPGDPLSAEAIQSSANRLRALGFFKSLEVRIHPGSTPRLVVVEFEVVEQATGQFQVGVGVGEAHGFFASAQVAQSNLFGSGNHLALTAQIAARDQRFNLVYQNPRILESWWRAGGRLYSTRRSHDAYDLETTGGVLMLGRQLAGDTRLELSYRLSDTRAELNDELIARLLPGKGALAAGLFRSGLTSSVRADLVHDSRSSELDGSATGAYTEIAAALLGSDNRFYRYGAWFAAPVRIHGPVGVVFRGSVDWIASPDWRGVPLSERLFAGGMGSVRGYEYGELGSRLTLEGRNGLVSFAYGGNLRLLASAELVFPLVSAIGLSGVAFADAGNVFDLEPRTCRRRAPDGCPNALSILSGLRASVGLGFRWASPVGRLRFEWGVPLVHRPGTPRARFHFGVGGFGI